MREAWIKEMIEQQKDRKKAQAGGEKRKAGAPGAIAAKTCRELLAMMPLAFNAPAAEGLTAVYQFEVQGDEAFVAHLRISEGACTCHEGPANKPNLTIKTPADVWLKISRGELNGQQAFMNGRYKVEGDMNLLLRMSRLFSR
jgi:putative sterol carrier protein